MEIGIMFFAICAVFFLAVVLSNVICKFKPSPKVDSPGAAGDAEYLKRCKEEAEEKLRKYEEEQSKIKAEADKAEFLKNNSDKYKFVVTTKDGTRYESQEFEAIADICHSFRGRHCYYLFTKTAKQVAEEAKESRVYCPNFQNYQWIGGNHNFLKVGDIDVNVNEILTKQVVKV